MIGAGLHGNGRHWDSVAPEERVIAMKVNKTSQMYILTKKAKKILTFEFSKSTGGYVKLLSAFRRFSARFRFAFS